MKLGTRPNLDSPLYREAGESGGEGMWLGSCLLCYASGRLAGDRLDILATLIDAYVDEHHPMDPPDPVDAIRFRMERQSLTRKDLEGIQGTRRRVAAVLNSRRELSITMIRRPHDNLGIPAEGAH